MIYSLQDDEEVIEKANQLMSAANSSMPPPSAPVSTVYTKTLVTKILSAKQGQIQLFDRLCTIIEPL